MENRTDKVSRNGKTEACCRDGRDGGTPPSPKNGQALETFEQLWAGTQIIHIRLQLPRGATPFS